MPHDYAIRIRRTVSGPMWHGLALAKLLRDVDAKSASARPITNAHSIWELVLHSAAWAEIVRARLSAATRVPPPTRDENFPPMPSPTEKNWQLAIKRLERSYKELAEAAGMLSDSDLSRKVPGKRQTVDDMLRGIIEHGTYHGGQIALLKRALSLPR